MNANQLHDYFISDPKYNGTVVVIFHCEFSSQRAPMTLRHMRKLDRIANWENWPSLYYPELYLLHGGYHLFFQEKPELCVPRNYVSMFDRKFNNTCKGEVRLARRRELTRSLTFSGPFGSRPIKEEEKEPTGVLFLSLDGTKINFSDRMKETDKENLSPNLFPKYHQAQNDHLETEKNSDSNVPRLCIWGSNGDKLTLDEEKYRRTVTGPHILKRPKQRLF